MINNAVPKTDQSQEIPRLQKFYNRLRENRVLQGLPEDYEQFQSALQDTTKRQQFFSTLKQSGRVQGLPDEYDSFNSLFDDQPSESGLTPPESPGRDFSRRKESAPAVSTAASRQPTRADQIEELPEYVSANDRNPEPPATPEDDEADRTFQSIGSDILSGVIDTGEELLKGVGRGIADLPRFGLELQSAFDPSPVNRLNASILADEIEDFQQTSFLAQDEDLSGLRFKDILQQPGKLPKWLASHAGQALPTMLPGLGTLKILGPTTRGAQVLAAMAGSSPIEIGAQLSDARQAATERGEAVSEEDKALALGSGLAAGAVEGVADVAMFKALKNIFSRAGLDDVAKASLQKEVAEQLGELSMRQIAGQAGKQMTIEGLTEATQEIIANTGAKYGWDPDRELLENTLDALVIGGTVGGGVVAAGGVGSKAVGALARRAAGEPGTVTEEGLTPEAGSIAPEIRFDWDPDASPQEQRQQLNNEGRRLIQERQQAEEAGGDVADFDTALAELEEIRSNIDLSTESTINEPGTQGEQAAGEVSNLEIGETGQWTSQGVDQFEESRRITDIQEDESGNRFVQFEGSDTYVPESEVTVDSQPDLSSTQVNIQGDLAERFRAAANQIPESELYTEKEGFGRENEPHVTVLYGLEQSNPDAVREVLSGSGPIELELGPLNIFQNDEFDVLYSEVNSPKLQELNQRLRDELPYKNDFPDYNPHVTIAYLKPGEGQKYVGDTRFEGETVTLNEVLFSDPDRQKTSIPLSETPQTTGESVEQAIPVMDGKYEMWKDDSGEFHLKNVSEGREVARTSPNWKQAETEFIARQWAQRPTTDFSTVINPQEAESLTDFTQVVDKYGEHLFDFHDAIQLRIEQGQDKITRDPAVQDVIDRFQGGMTLTAEDVLSFRPDEWAETPLLRMKVGKRVPGMGQVRHSKNVLSPDEIADIVNREYNTDISDSDVVDLWIKVHRGDVESGEFTEPFTQSLVEKASDLAGRPYTMELHRALSRQRDIVELQAPAEIVDQAYNILDRDDVDTSTWFDSEGNLNYNEAIAGLNELAQSDPEYAAYQSGSLSPETIGEFQNESQNQQSPAQGLTAANTGSTQQNPAVDQSDAESASSQQTVSPPPSDSSAAPLSSQVESQQQAEPLGAIESVTQPDPTHPLQSETAGPDPADQPSENQAMLRTQTGGAQPLRKATVQDMATHPVNKGQGVNLGDNYIPLVENQTDLPNSRERARDAKRREDILIPFLKALDIKIIEGRLRGNKYGDYMPATNRMRISRKSDIEVVAHEVAHLLENNFPSIKKLYQKSTYKTELRGVSYDVNKIQEGWAEFFRLYMTQPSKAQAVTPKFYKAFDRWMQNEADQTTREAIQTASEGMIDWLQQHPLDRMRSKIGYQSNVNDAQTRLRDLFRQSTVDDLHGIWMAERKVTGKKQMLNDGFLASARNTRGASAISGLVTEGGGIPYVDDSGNIKFRGKSLRDVFEPVGQSPEMLEDFMLYAVARRANKLQAEGRENLLTPAEIEAGLQLQSDVFDQVHREYQQWREEILDFSQDYGGIINPDARRHWDSTEYVPFYRVRERSLKSAVNNVFGKDVNPGEFTGIKRLTGGTQNLNDIFDNILKNTHMLVEASIKNRARLDVIDGIMSSDNSGQIIVPEPKRTSQAVISKDEIARILKENGILDTDLGDLDNWLPFWQMTGKPQGSGIISVMRDGQAEFYKVVDPLFYRAYSALDRRPRNQVMRSLNTVRRFIQMTITHTPDFLISIGLRDTLFAWATSKNNYRPFIDTAIGYVESLKKSQDYKDFIAAGGGLGGAPSSKALRRKMEQFYTQKGINWKRVAKSPADFLEMLETVINASESATRVAEYKRATARGLSNKAAAFEGREISVDYAMTGDNAYIQWLYDTVIFFKAMTVSLDRLIRVGIGPNKAQVAARIGALSGMSVLLLLRNRGIPEYQELEDWDKDAHWHFFIPDGEGGYSHWRYPKIWELGAVTSLAERTADATLNDMGFGDGTDSERNTSALKMLQNMYRLDMTPTIIKPLVEVKNNRNSFTGRQIETPFMQNLDKPYRAYSNGSKFADWVGSNIVTEMPEGIQVSPVQLEHLIRGYFGTWGLYFLMGTDQLMDPNAPASELADIPGLRRIAGREVPKNTKYTQAFYDLSDQMREAQTTADYLLDQNRPEEAATYEDSEYYNWWPVAQEYIRDIGFINSDIRELQNSRLSPLDPEEKREQLNEKYRERNDLMKEFVQDFKNEMEGENNE